jgi:hypothetical protein
VQTIDSCQGRGIGVSIPTMKHVFSIIRSLFFAALFISLQVWYLPRWVGIRGRWVAPMDDPWRWPGLVPIAFGAALALACVWRFGSGRP